MITAGIDAGSRTIKVVLFDSGASVVLARSMTEQGVDQARLAEQLFDRTLKEAGLKPEDLAGLVATGYGRQALRFARTTITEITCHAQGVHHLAPDARTIIEMGGQDSKVIRMEDGGQVRDFAMNDRCAAGTGRFLEVLASRLGVDFAELGELSSASRRPAPISSTCVVFAETEIVGLLADGTARADIAAGVQTAIVTRVAAMVGGPIEPPVYFTGGVALQAGMVGALEQVLACPVRVAPQPQFTGALGAAILATRQARRPGLR